MIGLVEKGYFAKPVEDREQPVGFDMGPTDRDWAEFYSQQLTGDVTGMMVYQPMPVHGGADILILVECESVTTGLFLVGTSVAIWRKRGWIQD